MARRDDGMAKGADEGRWRPSLTQLHPAIGEPASAEPAAASPDWLDALGRGGRGRRAPAERGLRAVHQAVLRSFAAVGRGPEPAMLNQAAAPFDAAQVLAELADGDFLCIDEAGQISVAYPSSAIASRRAGPSAVICCHYMNFFASSETAAAWASARPEITGGILSQDRAIEVGEQIFGQLLQ